MALFDADGVLERLRAADPAAVGMLWRARLDALDHDHGGGAILGQRQAVTSQGLLQLALADYTGVLSIEVGACLALLGAGGHNDHAVFDLCLNGAGAVPVAHDGALKIAHKAVDFLHSRGGVDCDVWIGMHLGDHGG